jgi:predicted house-cleaning noncanonical NTP pyrophosphatase (MazG superfamily)
VNLEKEINEIVGFKNLELLATQVVEGFISGLHKSPQNLQSTKFITVVKAPNI